MRLGTIAALSAALLLALSGTALADAKVTIGDDGFTPESVNVDIRESITWTNATDADVSLVGRDPNWESGPIEPGGTFQIKITENGRYSYATEDGSLEGTITVGAAAGQDDENGEDGEEAGKKDAAGKKDGEEGGEKDEKDRPAKRNTTVDPDDEALPKTGINAAVPGALSVLLIAFGAGLLVVTHPRQRLRA